MLKIRYIVLCGALALSASAAANPLLAVGSPQPSLCSSIEFKVSSTDQDIFDSVEQSTSFPSEMLAHLDRTLPIEVTYSIERCNASSAMMGSFSDLPKPDLAQEGDRRTVTQTRGGIESTYEQVFTGGVWITVKVTRRLIEPPPDSITG